MQYNSVSEVETNEVESDDTVPGQLRTLLGIVDGDVTFVNWGFALFRADLSGEEPAIPKPESEKDEYVDK